MNLRFRCEHCGKRLQVAEPVGAQVMCPFCSRVLVVPHDANPVAVAPTDPAPDAEGTAPDTAANRLVAVLATYIPTWGTSVVAHLALILVALATYTVIAQTDNGLAPEISPVVRPQNNFQKESGEDFSRSVHSKPVERPSDFVFIKTDNPIPDVANNLRPTIEAIGVNGSGGYMMGGDIGGFGRGRGGGIFTFTNDRAGPRKVVFIVDRSGSMTDSIMYVKQELRRAVERMRPSDHFHIIFFSDGPSSEMPTRKLVPATPANKQLAYDFIDSVIPFGQTDPSDALRRAFASKPAEVCFLTDGAFDASNIALIDKLNVGHKIAVNTIGFLYTDMEKQLLDIARRNNGVYKYISDDDLTRIQNGSR